MDGVSRGGKADGKAEPFACTGEGGYASGEGRPGGVGFGAERVRRSAWDQHALTGPTMEARPGLDFWSGLGFGLGRFILAVFWRLKVGQVGLGGLRLCKVCQTPRAYLYRYSVGRVYTILNSKLTNTTMRSA
jgi:hypothetical protein